MKRIALTLAIILTMVSVQAVAQPSAGSPDNRNIVTDFARLFYTERDVVRAFETHVAADYIQHNPGIADGREAPGVFLVG